MGGKGERQTVAAERLAELDVPYGTAAIHRAALVATAVKHRQVGGQLESVRQRPMGGETVGEIGDVYVLVGGEVAPRKATHDAAICTDVELGTGPEG